MSKPARPELVFHSLGEMVADVDRLKAGEYEKAGTWDLPMILDHMTKAILGEGVKPLPWPISAVARAVIHFMVWRSWYPTFIRIHAPGGMQPTRGIALATVYGEFCAAVEKLKTSPAATVRTPFGRLTTTLWIRLQLLHGAHHLSFLRLK